MFLGDCSWERSTCFEKTYLPGSPRKVILILMKTKVEPHRTTSDSGVCGPGYGVERPRRIWLQMRWDISACRRSPGPKRMIQKIVRLKLAWTIDSNISSMRSIVLDLYRTPKIDFLTSALFEMCFVRDMWQTSFNISCSKSKCFDSRSEMGKCTWCLQVISSCKFLKPCWHNFEVVVVSCCFFFDFFHFTVYFADCPSSCRPCRYSASEVENANFAFVGPMGNKIFKVRLSWWYWRV